MPGRIVVSGLTKVFRGNIRAVDQLSFQSPFIPIVFFGQTPGFHMNDFFTVPMSLAGIPATVPSRTLI